MRLAVDTNVLARMLVDDGSEQARLSRQCFENHEVYLSNTVLLETEWLLRSVFKVARGDVNLLLGSLLSSLRVQFESRAQAGTAVLAHKNGMDFADALHLVTAVGCDELATFDDDFIKRSATVRGAIPVRKP